jgi:hypothetical protein
MAVNNRSATKKGRKVVVVKKNAEKGVRKRSESVARHFRLALNFLDDALDVGCLPRSPCNRTACPRH